MNQFFLKFYLLIFGILLFAGGILFLLFNHVDTLYRFVPAEAENYLHIQPKSLNELSEGQRTEIYTWLKDHSSISEESWKNIFDSRQRELGLFSLNGQIFGVVRNSNKLKSLLLSNGISTAYNKQVIFFPHLTLSNPTISSLADQPWFKTVRQRLCFKDFILYSHNLNTLQLNMPLLKNAELPVTSFLGNFDDKTVKIETLGQVGQAKSSSIAQPLKTLPKETLSYFRNLRVEEMAKFNAVSDNLELSIIQTLSGAIEYYKDNAGSQVKISKAGLPREQLQKAILSSLAQLYPSRKERILPDGSVAINLIADEDAWVFVEAAPGEWRLVASTESDEMKLAIYLTETAGSYALTFGNPIMTGNNESKCTLPKFSKNGIIFSKTSNKNFNNLLILNKNQKKLSICID